jgi:cellulose synthase/poly-beta-1,6-N-acetylglucosamine synthase-like glycosyltransferase
MQILYFIQQSIIWIITIYYIYELLISIFSFVKLKEKPLIKEKNHKFICILPAHNEEAVIGNLVHSLQQQTYPKEFYDICVIADNCDDKTADIAKEAGAIVFERHEPDKAKRTKGFALQKYIGTLLADENMDYDAFCIFDADNIVDEKFLEAMNKHLCQGEEVVQGYRDIKNPTDSWIASGYALFYWMMNRFYHLARYNAGLSALLNGTGFMVKFDCIRNTGWDTNTLTEDIEFSIKSIIGGKKVGWATDAKVYDEEPVDFKPSWKQRQRWTVGHIQVLKEYTMPLFKSTKEFKSLANIDGLLYIAGSIPMFVVTILLLFSNAIVYLNQGMTTEDFLINILKYIIPTFFVPIIAAAYTMVLEKKSFKGMWKGLLLYPLFMGSWLLINFKCLFVQNTSWDKIDHTRSVKIEEVKK